MSWRPSYVANIKSCVVPCCSTTSKDPVNLYKFPVLKKRALGEKWLEALQCEELSSTPYEKIGGRCCVCANHFISKAIITTRDFKTRLNPDVVPTLNLPLNIVPWIRSEDDAPISVNQQQAPSDSQVTDSDTRMDCEHSDVSENQMDVERIENKVDEKVVVSSIKSGKRSNGPIIKEDRFLGKKLDFLTFKVKKSRVAVAKKVAGARAMEVQNGELTIKHEPSAQELALQREVHVIRKMVKQLNEDKTRLAENMQTLTESYDKKLEAARQREIRAKKSLAACRTELAEQKDVVEAVQRFKPEQRVFFEIFSMPKSKGRRFTRKQKLQMAVRYCRCPKQYRLDCQTMDLPCEKTVQRFMKELWFSTGVTLEMKQRLKEAVSLITNPLDKFIILMWDEMKIKPHLDYDPTTDKIIGFEEWDKYRTTKLADHALCFMIRSLNGSVIDWKMPVAYGFCSGTMPAIQLEWAITDVVKALTECGLTVAATVCDQASTNRSVINTFLGRLDESKRAQQNLEKYNTIVIADQEIVHLYDGPHILKCIRNNLLKYLLRMRNPLDYTKWITISWDVIVRAYEIDLRSGRDKKPIAEKLSEDHLNINKLNKMRVKHALQIFSSTVADGIETLKNSNVKAQKDGEIISMPDNSLETSTGVRFLDNVIDAMNGKGSSDKPSCYRSVLKNDTDSLKRLRSALPVLREARFIDKETGKPARSHIPCLENLCFTIDSLLLLWKRLERVGFEELDQRKVNQDCMENMFGRSRLIGQTVSIPTCRQFSSHFLILLMQYMVDGFSLRKTNCMKDHAQVLFEWHESFNVVPGFTYIPVRRKPELTDAKLYLSPRLIHDIKAQVEKLSVCAQCMEALANKLDKIFPSEIAASTRTVVTFYYEQFLLKRQVCELLHREINVTSIFCKHDADAIRDVIIPITVRYYIEYATDILNKILTGRLNPINTDNELVKHCRTKYEKTLRKKNRVLENKASSEIEEVEEEEEEESDEEES